jgi:hypothetical protein
MQPMKSLIFIFFFLFTYISVLSQSCTHTIRRTDTYGDGWNGGLVAVSVNGVTVLSNLSCTGYGPSISTFTAAAGSVIRVYRTTPGIYPSEMRVQVLNNVGTILINTIQPVAGTPTSGGNTCIASCSSSIPSNDLVCNATLISCGQSISGTTIGATISGYGESSSCGVVQSYPGVWYKIIGNGQIMTASLCTTGWDSKISVFSGTCSSLTCVGGNDDNGPSCGGTPASYSWTSVNGLTYWILVHGYSSNSTFTLSLNCVSPPTPGPCTNTIAYGSQFMPVFQGAPYETIYCQFAGEYSTWYNAILNTPYVVTSSVPTDWITIRQGTYNGPVIAVGTHPVNFVAPTTGNIFIHINANSYCATQSICRNVIVSRISALPVKLLYFEGEKKESSNYLHWATATEHNTTYFIVEKSENGITWSELGTVSAAGNSTQEIHYDLTDNSVKPIFNYYRLTQYDMDGAYEIFDPISINNKDRINIITKRINLAGQEVNENATGFIIEIYEDGTIKRVFKI